MGSDSDSDGHPIDDYLTRAAKRPRVGAAATPNAPDGYDENGGAGEDGELQNQQIEDDGAADDGTDDSDDYVDDSHDGSMTSEDVDADGPGDGNEGDEGEHGDGDEDGEGDEPIGTPGADDEAAKGAAEGAGADQGQLAASTAVRKIPFPTDAKPVGVIIVGDTSEIIRDSGVVKLLRNPRYFDDYSDVQTQRCFNCGQIGHQARECTNQARVKPCHLCAQFGHDGRNCPNRLCYRCGQPGHKLRDCRGREDMPARSCIRCGREDCDAAGKGDYFRYEGGCSRAYTPADLRHVRCMCCGDFGHLMCKPAPKAPAAPSCFNCGRLGHYGDCCPSGTRPHLLAERRGDEEREAAELLEYDMQMERDFWEENRRREQPQRGYGGGGGGGGGGYDRRRDGGDGGGYTQDIRRGGGGGGRNAQIEWGYEPTWVERRGGMAGEGRPRRYSPEPYPRGRPPGGHGYDERRPKTPRW